MPRVRNISGEDRVARIPSTGVDVPAPADGVIDVPAEDLDAFTCQADVWQEHAKTEKKTEGKS